MKRIIIEIVFPQTIYDINEKFEEISEILTNLKHTLNNYKIEDGNENLNYVGIKTTVKIE